MPADTIGPYLLKERLGSGGMGVVHRALAPDGTEVAIKLLATELRADALVKRFEREARIRINHPNVAPVLDAGVSADGTPFIVLSLLRGESLAERFARARPTPGELVAWAVQICAGLGAAHDRGIVHRDVKPSNIFLCDDGIVRVLDFGVALVDDGHTRLTQAGAVPGTVGYLSPEQAKGRVTVDARSDLWSLGATLYEGLTGAVPFQQDSPLATIVATLVGELIPIRRRAPQVSPALARVIERALSREREARYASAAAFSAALAAADLGPASEGAATPRTAPSIRPGEQRVIVVLFADGVRDPDLFEQSVVAQGGSPLQLAGDRALGLFGTRTWEGDETDRAARAALAARPAADRLAIASGWATSAEGGIAGAALAAAERCAAASPHAIAVDAEAARSLRDSHTLDPIAAGIFTLRDPTTDLIGPSISDEITTVDREAEQTELHAALRSVLADRRPLVILITGPAGIGKTRVRTDLERHTRATFPEVTCETMGAIGARPDSHHDTRDSPSISGVDLGVQRDRARAAWLERFGEQARHGLVLFVEDLHRLDDDSIERLEDLVDRQPDSPLLIVATARPEIDERASPPFAGRDVVRVALRGLGRGDVATLAARVAGRPLPDDTISALTERTGGNPLFVIQSVRALLDAAPDAEGPLPVPATIEATVLARLDHLPTDERDLCRRASIWSRAFALDEARAVGVPDPEPLLSGLVRRDLITIRGRGKTATYTFRSGLVSDVAYRSLGEDIRRELHRAAAAYLSGATPALAHAARTAAATPALADSSPAGNERRGGDPEELARHHELGGEDAAAAAAYVQAVRVTVRRGDVQSALRCAERAIALGAPDASRFELHALRVDALRFLGRKAEQGSALDDALDAARTDAERARALSERAVFLWRSGAIAPAVAAAADATAAARASSDRDALTLARGREFLVLEAAGRSREAEAALAEAVAASATADPTLRATALAWRAHHLAQRGDLGERLAAFSELAELYDDLGDRRRAAGARANLADVYNRIGAYADAAEALEAALTDCRRVGHRTMEGYTLLNLGYSRIALGTPEIALPLLDTAATIATSTGEARLEALITLYRARAHFTAGDHALAASTAEPLVSSTIPDLQTAALALAARAHLRLGDTTRALDLSARAMKIYDTLGRLEEDEGEIFLARLEALGSDPEATPLRERAHRRIAELAAAITDEPLRARFLATPTHAALLKRN